MRLYSLGPCAAGGGGACAGSEKAPVAPGPADGPYAGVYGAGGTGTEGTGDGGGGFNLPNICVNSPG
jgi:hypothetical protein